MRGDTRTASKVRAGFATFPMFLFTQISLPRSMFSLRDVMYNRILNDDLCALLCSRRDVLFSQKREERKRESAESCFSPTFISFKRNAKHEARKAKRV